MKKLYFILTVLILVYFLCACSGQTLRTSSEIACAQPSNLSTEFDGILVDNVTPLQDTLTVSYSLAELEAYFGNHTWVTQEDPNADLDTLADLELELSLSNAAKRFPCSILRYTLAYNNSPGIYKDEVIYRPYSVYRVQEGGYFYVFWSLDSYYAIREQTEPSFYTVDYALYPTRLCQLAEFDQLIPGQSTYEDVRTIDSTADLWELSPWQNTYCSHSILENGILVAIEYQLEENTANTTPSVCNLIIQNILVEPSQWPYIPYLNCILPNDLPQFLLEQQTEESPWINNDAVSNPNIFSSTALHESQQKLDSVQIDNDTPLSDVLTTEYPLSELEEYFGPYSLEEIQEYDGQNLPTWLNQHNLVAVNQTFPIQVLRTVSLPSATSAGQLQPEESASPSAPVSLAYSVYPVEEGGYYYTFWTKYDTKAASDQLFDYVLYDAFYLKELPQFSDFTALVAGQSTLADVLEIDPAADLDYRKNGYFQYEILCYGDWQMYEQWAQEDGMWPPQDRELYSVSLLNSGKLLVVFYQPTEPPGAGHYSPFLDRSNWVVDTIMLSAAGSTWTPLLQYVLYEDLP